MKKFPRSCVNNLFFDDDCVWDGNEKKFRRFLAPWLDDGSVGANNFERSGVFMVNFQGNQSAKFVSSDT